MTFNCEVCGKKKTIDDRNYRRYEHLEREGTPNEKLKEIRKNNQEDERLTP
jgi:hypothetical protein